MGSREENRGLRFMSQYQERWKRGVSAGGVGVGDRGRAWSGEKCQGSPRQTL